VIDALTGAPDAARSPQQPLLARARDTFLAPTRLFATIGAGTPFAGVLALATAVAMVAVAAEPDEYYLAQMEEPVNRRGAPVEITSPPAQIVLWGRMMAMFSALVGHPLLAFAGAGVLTILFRTLGRGRGDFRRYLVVASHGLLIASVGMLSAVALRAVTGDPAALPTVGTLLGLSRAGLLGGVLHGINLFTLWMLAVVAVGAAAIEPRVTRGAATALLWAGYGVIIVTVAVLFRA
jgi:hypothetical protein